FQPQAGLKIGARQEVVSVGVERSDTKRRLKGAAGLSYPLPAQLGYAFREKPLDSSFSAHARLASSRGRVNTTRSVMPSRGTTFVAPNALRRAITSSTRTSGAEAPAVTPTR